MISQATLDSLALRASDAVLTSCWATWLADVGHVFEAPKVYLVPVPLPKRPSTPIPGAVLGYSETQRADYYEHFAATDLLRQRFIQAQSMRGYTTSMLVQDDEYLNSAAFNEFALPNGSRYVLGVLLDIGSPHRYLLGCARPPESAEFSKAEIHAMERLALFVRQWLRLEFVLRASQARSDTIHWILEQVTVGAVLLTANLGLVFANRAASELLRSGEIITTQQGRLVAAEKKSGRRLEDAASLVSAGACRQKLIPLSAATAAGPQISAIVAACPRAYQTMGEPGSGEPVLVVFLLSHAPKGSPSPHRLSISLGLSPKEATVASMLVGGADLSEIAAAVGVSREGVRYHLKRVFWKTGSHSQQELVRTITHLSTPVHLWQEHQELV